VAFVINTSRKCHIQPYQKKGELINFDEGGLEDYDQAASNNNPMLNGKSACKILLTKTLLHDHTQRFKQNISGKQKGF
jgi:hypothetical protein